MNRLRTVLLGLCLAIDAVVSLGAAVTFVEPGGDQCACLTPWTTNGSPVITTSTVHTGRSSISLPSGNNSVASPNGVVSDAGGRLSYWVQHGTPTTNAAQTVVVQNSSPAQVFNVRMSGTTGKLALNTAATALCAGTTVLSANTWYRISVSFVITNTTTHVIKLYLNGAQECSETNAATLVASGSTRVLFGAATGDALVADDFYIDNSSANTEPGEGNAGTMALTIGLRSVGTGVR